MKNLGDIRIVIQFRQKNVFTTFNHIFWSKEKFAKIGLGPYVFHVMDSTSLGKFTSKRVRTKKYRDFFRRKPCRLVFVFIIM